MTSPSARPGADRQVADENVARCAALWRMPPDIAQTWLALPSQVWARQVAADLHRAGLTATQAQHLHDTLPRRLLAALVRLVGSARAAGLDPTYLELWYHARLLRIPAYGRGGKGAQEAFTAWVTDARAYVRATGGDQHMAALAAAVNISVDEVTALRDAGTLNLDALRLLYALRADPDPDDD